MTLQVAELTDEKALAAFLGADRLWTAYALCDLDLPYRLQARFFGALSPAGLEAVVLAYTSAAFQGMLTFGTADGVAAIVGSARGLPRRAFFLTGEEHIRAVETCYALSERWAMLRMAVDRASFTPPASDVPVRPLSIDDLDALQTLYTAAGGAHFDPPMLAHGKYAGVFEGSRLVGVAGTHAWSARYRIGAVGGVFTHPGRRRRGLATATTGAVVQALFDAGVEDVVLNVRSDNGPAVSAYLRLGFAPARSYLEGEGTARPD